MHSPVDANCVATDSSCGCDGVILDGVCIASYGYYVVRRDSTRRGLLLCLVELDLLISRTTANVE